MRLLILKFNEEKAIFRTYLKYLSGKTRGMRKLKLDELNRLSVTEFKDSDKIPVIVVLENIRSLSNVGAMFRTADAFKIEAIHLVGITARPPHREIQKTALGATESVDWIHFETIDQSIEATKSKGYKILSVEQTENSTSIEKLDQIDAVGVSIILGHEVDGVEQTTIEKSDYCIEIPQFGTKHSLNVGVCGGIVMYELWKKFG
ncbi:MAG: 23S rRNA (guanosine2251-2'-O)-methyltransferase [Glaciecola sp.]